MVGAAERPAEAVLQHHREGQEGAGRSGYGAGKGFQNALNLIFKPSKRIKTQVGAKGMLPEVGSYLARGSRSPSIMTLGRSAWSWQSLRTDFRAEDPGASVAGVSRSRKPRDWPSFCCGPAAGSLRAACTRRTATAGGSEAALASMPHLIVAFPFREPLWPAAGLGESRPSWE